MKSDEYGDWFSPDFYEILPHVFLRVLIMFSGDDFGNERVLYDF